MSSSTWDLNAAFVGHSAKNDAAAAVESEPSSLLRPKLRIESVKADWINALRRALGTLVAAAVIAIEPVDSYLNGSAKFFAVVIPALAVDDFVGQTVRVVALSLPVVFAFVFFAAFLVQGLSNTSTTVEFVLVGLGIAFIEWGGAFMGPLGKKLAGGLFLTVVLSHRLANTLPVGLDTATKLILGLLIGYAGGFIGSLLPPRSAARTIRKLIGRVSGDFALLIPRILKHYKETQDLDMQSISFEEESAFLFGEIISTLDQLEELIPLAHMELPWRSYEPVREYHQFFHRMRRLTRGLRWCHHNMDVKNETYLCFRETLFCGEQALADQLQAFFEAMAANPDQDVSKTALRETFERVKEDVLEARKRLIKADIAWNEDPRLRDDFFVSYAALSSMAQMVETIEAFSQGRWSKPSCEPTKEVLWSVVDSFSIFPFDTLPARLINVFVITTAVLIASIFVLVPEVEARFPNAGVSAAVTCVFVFSRSGFGSSLRTSRDRLMGITIGFAYSYFSVTAYGNVVALTAAMVCWVLFAFTVLGVDRPYMAKSSVFAVSLALYNAGEGSVSEDQVFVRVSSFLVANTIAVLILICVEAVFWLLAVFTSRPKFVGSLTRFIEMLAENLNRRLSQRLRGEDAPMVHRQLDMRNQLKEIHDLWEESEAEPTILSIPAPHDVHALFDLYFSLARHMTFLDFQSADVVKHVDELRKYGMMRPDFVEAVERLETALQATLLKCSFLCASITAGRLDLVSNKSSAIQDARRRLATTLVENIKTAGMDKSYISSRASVRLIATVHAWIELARKVDTLWETLLVVVVAVRQKTHTKR